MWYHFCQFKVVCSLKLCILGLLTSNFDSCWMYSELLFTKQYSVSFGKHPLLNKSCIHSSLCIPRWATQLLFVSLPLSQVIIYSVIIALVQLFSSLSSAKHSAPVPCPLNLIAFLTLCPPDADWCDPPPTPQSGQIEMLIQISTCFTSATTNNSDPMSENCLVNQQKWTKI